MPTDRDHGGRDPAWVGPNTPGLVVVEHPDELERLAALGLILLLIHLGLEFSLGDLVGGGRPLLVAGGTYLLLNVGGGLAFGFALRWGTSEARVIAGAVGISSSAIVTRLVIELRRLANPESHLILGITFVQDIFLALYLALLQPVLGDAETAAEGIVEFLTALGFLLVLASIARWGATWIGELVATPDGELLTVCFVGLAVLIAGTVEELGVCAAIGAFGVGVVLAGSPAAERIERLVLPLRDALAAVFFFSFGLAINHGHIGDAAGPVLAAVALSLLLNLAAGIIAARRSDLRRLAGVNIGLTLLGRGEFSLILAALATTAGLDERVDPFVAVYVLVLALVGPLLTAHSSFVADRLPAGLLPTGIAP